MNTVAFDTQQLQSLPDSPASVLPTGYYFMVPVWGQAYVRLFIETALRCQLAPGNLPALTQRSTSRYLIFTTPADAETIHAAPAFAALSRLLPVDIVLIEDEIVVPHDTMSACYRRGIALADAVGAASVFLTPDLVLADGAIVALQRLVAAGKRVVHVPGIRTIKQGVEPALPRGDDDEAIAITPRALMRITLDNLHPLALSSFWNEYECDLIPANLYWRVGQGGILARCFHLHPLLVFPETKQAAFAGTVDDDYVMSACPDETRDYVVTDSDELLLVELSDAGRLFLTGIRKGSVDDVAAWAERAANWRHRRMFEVPIRLHDGTVEDGEWRVAERRAAKTAAAVRAALTRSWLRLFLTNARAFEGRVFRLARENETRADGHLSHVQPARIDSLSRRGAALLTGLQSRYRQTVYVIADRIHRLKSMIFGRPEAPRPFSAFYSYYRAVERDSRMSLAELGPRPVIAAPLSTTAKWLASLAPHEATATVYAVSGGICRLTTLEGEPLPEQSATGLYLALGLQDCGDLEAVMAEADRLLSDQGLLAIRTVRLFEPGIIAMEQRVQLSFDALRDAMRSRFEVVDRRRQGAVGSLIGTLLFRWLKMQAARVRLPFFVMAPLSLMMLPLHMVVSLIARLAIGLLDSLDGTGQFYVSSVLIARRTPASDDDMPAGAADCHDGQPAQ